MTVALPRSAWGARAPKCSHSLVVPTPELFIHHEGSAFNSVKEADEIATMKAIQNDHMDTRGWCDIAYSFVVFPSGACYVGRGWRVEGGATFGHNTVSHSICWAGNMMVQQPTLPSLVAGLELRDEGKANGSLAANVRILGHRDATGGYPQNQTVCPGDHLEAKLDYLRTGGTDMGGEIADQYFQQLDRQGISTFDYAGTENFILGFRFAARGIKKTDPLYIRHDSSPDFVAGYNAGLKLP